MDAKERDRITEVLFDSRQPWTLLVVTSRPELLGRCDRVLHMPDGAVKEVR